MKRRNNIGKRFNTLLRYFEAPQSTAEGTDIHQFMWTPDIPALTQDWRAVLTKEPRAIVFFWARWSQPDKALSQVLSRVTPDFADRITFYSADLDEEFICDLAVESGVLTNPTLVFCRSGDPVEISIGFLIEADLRVKLELWVAS